MACSNLNDLTKRQKAEMGQVVKSFKKSGMTTGVFEEGLRVLSSERRPTADEISNREAPYASIACTYGKGYRYKLTLSREDATLLLDMVTQLRKAAPDEESAKKMVALAAGVIFEGIAPPKTITDPSWVPVLRLIRETAPSAHQQEMF